MKANTTEYRSHTFEAECKLIRELAAAPENIPDIRAAVRADMFQDSNARELWKTLCGLFDAGEISAINEITLYHRAPNKNWYQDNILALSASCSTFAIREYAAAIVSGYESMKVLELAGKLTAAAVRGTTAPEALEILHKYEREAAASAPLTGRAVSIQDAFNELCDELQSGRGCVPTGFPSLDAATYGGLEDGNLVIIAARPSVGKTALALHLARGMAAAGKRVVIYSLEMTRTELVKRISIGTGAARAIDYKRDAPNWNALEKSASVFEKWPIFVDDTSRRLEDIRAEMVLEKNRRGLDIAFVDFLGLVRSPKGDNTPQYLRIEDIVIQMKELAKELRIPVVLLCQLNREAEKEGRDPQLFDLRDSGAIEQAADIVIMLQAEDEESRRITALVEKNRHGRKKFRIDLERNESYTQFWEVEPESSEDHSDNLKS